MNDFTKEELEDLLKYVTHPLWTNSQHLSNKIQFMIENYCEHEADFMEPNDIQCKFCSKSLIGND